MHHIFSFSDKGPRLENQDSFCAERVGKQILLGVADGVGGNNGGEIASRFAIETLISGVTDGLSVSECADMAHEGILQMALDSIELRGMATTLTAVACDNYIVTGVHCGDSRAYILRGNGVKQLTTDHTEAARLLADGKITKSEYASYPRKNVLVSALGTHREFLKETFTFQCQAGDRLLLLSDGIYAEFSKRELQSRSASRNDFEQFFEEIIVDMRERGPKDNYTLVGLEFE
ncbi:PP2C family protein-serine/threonine phosphatase [Pandoraea apista]|uniref:PP2C family protein-serine/threonine phosphatase n=1 Tax=Pandoraea apista TaxID=93218 RepID=UPI00248D86FB|nr:protein phosphatase 2C domain-containing protein [Pandoraea apista]